MTVPLFQNDPKLFERPSIEPYGCHFRVLGHLVEHKAQRAMSVDEVLRHYDMCLADKGLIDEQGYQSYVMSDTRVIRAAQRVLGVPERVTGVFRRGTSNDFSRDDIEANAWVAEYRILGLGGAESRLHHFCEIWKDGQIKFDPLWPTRQKIETVSIRGYRL